MLLQPKDIQEVFGAGGELFERMMNDLVRDEARRLRLADNVVHWDQRTNVPDGGCDIWVADRHADKSSFIPLTEVSISLKSGEDGIEVATFKDEVLRHPLILSRLKEGGSYLWCCPRDISQPKRDAFVARAKELASEIGCKPEQFTFFWGDAILARLERSPALIAEHLPKAWQRVEGLVLIKNWKPDHREPVRIQTSWVNFGDRDAVKRIIRDHLIGDSTNRLLHIAGLSGTGKTRTVIEACRDDDRLGDTIYSPRLSDAADRFLKQLEANGATVRLVIDEVPLTDYDMLARRVEDLPANVRIVSLGPARANEVQREGILILSAPSSIADVAKVVRASGKQLDEDSIDNIASFAGRDLRLAMLLVEATTKIQGVRMLPLRDNRDVWTRVRSLYKSDIACADFDYLYALLTATVDIGVRGAARRELAYLAEHFGESIGKLEACVRDANSVGLGLQPADYFEATPQSLAQWIFFDKAWPVLKNSIDQFLLQCPTPRLQRKFLERCQDLPEGEREAVMTVVRGFFLKHFGEPVLGRLRQSEASRLFQTWTETDPAQGLEWLLQAVRRATQQQLEDFDGENSFRGGWNGRRQIVWMCENLSGFRKWFFQVEEILFWLSHVETEKAIANNGTAVWKALFHPLLSYTEVPFDDRVTVLVNRIRDADGRSLQLLVSAVFAMSDESISRIVPSRVVGGRVRPPEWRPKTYREARDCVSKAIRELLMIAIHMPANRADIVLAAVVSHLGKILDLGLLIECRRFVDSVNISEDSARQVRKALDDWMSLRRVRAGATEKFAPYVEDAQEWRDALSPQSLSERVKDLTGRAFWDHLMHERRTSPELPHEDRAKEINKKYQVIAAELADDVRVLEGLKRWFDSESNKSGDVLAHAVALLDYEVIHKTFAHWITEGIALSTCAGYIRGLVEKQRRDAAIDSALTVLVSSQPGTALKLSVMADFTSEGFDRIVNCLATCNPDDLWVLRQLGTYAWRGVLTQERIILLATHLHRLQQIDSYRSSATASAVGMLQLIYSEQRIDDHELSKVVLSILEVDSGDGMPNAWEWIGVAQAVQRKESKQVCRLTIRRLLDKRVMDTEALLAFASDCARVEPDEAISVVAEVLQERASRWIFISRVFRGLFESIGIATLAKYLDIHPDHAVYFARHLRGPGVDAEGLLEVPEVTDWFLKRYGADAEVWNEFLLGRHSFEVMSVPEGYIAARELASKFCSHPTEWVRRWAESEVAEMEREIEMSRVDQDRFERE
jgi:hypothetical protein